VDARSYEEAVRLPLDLREVAVRAGELDEFGRRLADLKQRHGRKRGFFDLGSTRRSLPPAAAVTLRVATHARRHP